MQAEADVDRFVSILRAYATEGVEGLRVLHLNSLDEILPGIREYILAVEDNPDTAKTSGFSPHRAVAKPLLHILPSGQTPSESSADLFDKLLWVDPPPTELLDQDKQALIIDVYLRYRIVNQVRFRGNLQTETVAQARIGDIVIAAFRDEVASSTYSQIIGSSVERDESGDATVIPTDSRSEIMEKVLAGAGDQIRNQNFGVELTGVRIKRVSFPTEVAVSMFERMRAEQKRIVNKLRAEGQKEADQTRADADRQVAVILAESQLVADAISTEGEKKALEIFRNALAQVPELSVYLKSLDAYGVSKGLSD